MPVQTGAHLGGARVPAVLESRVGGYSLDQGLGVQKVVRGVLGGPGHGSGALDLLRKAHRPLVGLLCPHRASGNELQFLDAKALAQEPLLGANVVADAHAGELGSRERTGGVVRRGGEAFAKLVHDHYEVLVRVQRVLGPDVGLREDSVRA